MINLYYLQETHKIQRHKRLNLNGQGKIFLKHCNQKIHEQIYYYQKMDFRSKTVKRNEK